MDDILVALACYEDKVDQFFLKYSADLQALKTVTGVTTETLDAIVIGLQTYCATGISW